MSEVKRPRRHFLSKRRDALERCDTALAGVWQSKQEAEPGVALAADFPHRSLLASAGYTTIEDIDGADEAELVRAGLNNRQARAVLAALA